MTTTLTTQQRLKKFECRMRESLAASVDGLPDNDLAMLIRKAIAGSGDAETKLQKISDLVALPDSRFGAAVKEQRRRTHYVLSPPRHPVKRGKSPQLFEKDEVVARNLTEAGPHLDSFPNTHDRFVAAMRYGR